MDTSLIPRLRPWIEVCPAPDLGLIFQTLVDLWENESSDITPSLVINALQGHPARNIVAGISEHARTADDPARLFEGAVEFLKAREHSERITRLTHEIHRLEAQATGSPSAAQDLEAALTELLELKRQSAPD